jgi:hypothetical protein
MPILRPDSNKAKARDRGNNRLFRFKRIPMRFSLPNIVTLLALCAGVTAIRLGIEGRFELAVAAVIVAIVLDAVDGRLARLLKARRNSAPSSIRWPTSSISASPRRCSSTSGRCRSCAISAGWWRWGWRCAAHFAWRASTWRSKIPTARPG